MTEIFLNIALTTTGTKLLYSIIITLFWKMLASGRDEGCPLSPHVSLQRDDPRMSDGKGHDRDHHAGARQRTGDDALHREWQLE